MTTGTIIKDNLKVSVTNYAEETFSGSLAAYEGMSAGLRNITVPDGYRLLSNILCGCAGVAGVYPIFDGYAAIETTSPLNYIFNSSNATERLDSVII